MNAQKASVLLAALAVACIDGPTVAPGEPQRLSCSIPETLIYQGQVRDGIPSLTHPGVATVENAEPTITDDERVLGMVVNGAARAYPLAIMRWHEVVNDTLGGVQILVTYCPLTGSGLAFDPVIDGTGKNFGVSGLLYENNLIMYDRQSSSLWVQMLLGSQCGPNRGRSLERLPIVETTWKHWKETHPETTTLNFATGFVDRDYNANPYFGYERESGTFFPSAPFSNAREAKELVFGVFRDSNAVVFPFEAFGQATSYATRNDSVGGTPFLVTYVTDEKTAVAFDRRVNGQVLTFSTLSVANRTVQDAETGSTWDEMGLAIDGPLAGEQLVHMGDAFVAYWFAWSVYYPDLRVVQ